MSKFNLLDEPWISVITDEKGSSQEVSLKELFENAHLYKDLAGDTKTQDFAVMRVLLAILHTVFSRFDDKGEVYTVNDDVLFELNERYQPREAVDEVYLDEYETALYQTWFNLWWSKKFPVIINDYLEKWRDRFYLFDETYPFFQVVADDVPPEKVSGGKPTEFYGKNLNRRISESRNKFALFSPKCEHMGNKEKLSNAEVARWLLTLHGYAGLADKVMFGKEKYKASKGWLFDIGGVYLNGENLFETLLLNLVLANRAKNHLATIQKPCWEYKSAEVIKRHFSINHAQDMASLFTTWSRGVYIDPEFEENAPFSCYIVKLPEIEHCDNFLEPMTLWKYNDTGGNKGKYTPRKHMPNQAVWRSFGLIALAQQSEYRVPGVIDWINQLKERSPAYIENKSMIVSAVSMRDDGNATSWVPVDEILDSLSINELILTDTKDEGWVVRINAIVEFTKQVISGNYKHYIQDIKAIRNIATDSFVSQKIEELYYKIDAPFRIWLANIKPGDSMDTQMGEWQRTLKQLVKEQAKQDINHASVRDYMGIKKNDGIENIATAYNRFMTILNKKFS